MSGTDVLDKMIGTLRALDGAQEEIARVAAPLVEAAVKKTAAAGTSPDGVPWPPRKDGAPALQNAAAAVEAAAIGRKIQVRLVGTATGDQRAQAIQNHTRPILPVRGRLGAGIEGALKQAVELVFKRRFGQ